MTARIRRATAADLPTLSPAYAAFFAEDAIETPQAELDANLARMLAYPQAAIFVAEADDGLVGFSSATLSVGAEFGLGSEIEDLYVAPRWRGRGLARRLLEAAIGWAQDQGAQELMLVVTPEAEADQGLTQLYEKFGFRASGRILMYRSGEDPAP